MSTPEEDNENRRETRLLDFGAIVFFLSALAYAISKQPGCEYLSTPSELGMAFGGGWIARHFFN